MPPKRKVAAEDDKKDCPQGATCTRENPLHLKQFSHPESKRAKRGVAQKAVNHDDDDGDDDEQNVVAETTTTTVATTSKVVVQSATAVTATTTQTTATKHSSRQLKIGESKAQALAAAAAHEQVVGKWEHIEGCLVLTHPACKPNDRIVAFDMDDTLIRTKSGRKFGVSSDDWIFWSTNVVPKCKALVAEGYKLVIFTNQGGINGAHGYDRGKEKVITSKIESIMQTAGLPFQVFVATSDDIYRKPSTAMWDLMAKSYNAGVAPNLASSTFVGDAAGRAAGHRAGAKKDFACTDRKFALNCGISFATPDAFFDGHPEAPHTIDGFDPTDVIEATTTTITSTSTSTKTTTAVVSVDGVCDGGVASLVSKKQELVLMVGWPASGKSTLAKTYLVPAGYDWVNQDTLKTAPKCLAKAIEALDAGRSCVVDNTNPKAETRAMYIEAARQRGIPVRCFRFTASRELAEHLNKFRERMTDGAIRHVPKIAYNIFNKNFQEPQLSEGFVEIKKINFVARHESDKARQMFQLLA